MNEYSNAPDRNVLEIANTEMITTFALARTTLLKI